MHEDIINDDNLLYEAAVNFFENKDYDRAFGLFKKLGSDYECGYCKLMCAELDQAQRIWQNTAEDSSAIKWGLSLINLIEKNIPQGLTFFQIRNFLERDLGLLIERKFYQYAKNVMDASEILCEYNAETPKFIGRVLLYYGYLDLAFLYLNKAKNVCYTDPEVHYLLARYYIIKGQSSLAEKVLKNSLKFNPFYFPTKNLLNQLCQDL